ncbi:MAG: hypothetical protein JWP10_717 [Nocardioidaceae bacterium]|nr:hypothetical protein [Nocardioidaceae bacterium]
MSRTGQIVAGAAATLAASVAGKIVADRLRVRRHLRRGEDTPFGSLHSDPISLVAYDGIRLNAEVDQAPNSRVPTVIFVHGWVLNLDAWHYQRAAFRGEVRLVFYDQRSHGKSDQAEHKHCSVEDLADDLLVVIEQLAPTGKIILVGHSMGGMTIMAFAARHAVVFESRVAGVVLCATSAGQLMRAGSALTRVGPFLRASTLLFDAGRSLNSYRAVKRYAIGRGSEEKYAAMTYEMIAKTKTRTFVDFYPLFLTLDLYGALADVGQARTTIIGGTRDQLTPARHSKKLAELTGGELIMLEGRGHMLVLEDHETVSEAIATMIENT